MTTIPRRKLLSFFVQAPVALGILTVVGEETAARSGEAQAPISEPHVSPDGLVEMTFREEPALVEITSFGDVWRRYALSGTHFYINGIEVSEGTYREQLAKLETR